MEWLSDKWDAWRYSGAPGRWENEEFAPDDYAHYVPEDCDVKAPRGNCVQMTNTPVRVRKRSSKQRHRRAPAGDPRSSFGTFRAPAPPARPSLLKKLGASLTPKPSPAKQYLMQQRMAALKQQAEDLREAQAASAESSSAQAQAAVRATPAVNGFRVPRGGKSGFGSSWKAEGYTPVVLPAKNFFYKAANAATSTVAKPTRPDKPQSRTHFASPSAATPSPSWQRIRRSPITVSDDSSAGEEEVEPQQAREVTYEGQSYQHYFVQLSWLQTLAVCVCVYGMLFCPFATWAGRAGETVFLGQVLPGAFTCATQPQYVLAQACPNRFHFYWHPWQWLREAMLLPETVSLHTEMEGLAVLQEAERWVASVALVLALTCLIFPLLSAKATAPLALTSVPLLGVYMYQASSVSSLFHLKGALLWFLGWHQVWALGQLGTLSPHSIEVLRNGADYAVGGGYLFAVALWTLLARHQLSYSYGWIRRIELKLPLFYAYAILEVELGVLQYLYATVVPPLMEKAGLHV
jgi:hypothetical protein